MDNENLPLPTDPVITIQLPDELLGTTLPDAVINSNIRNLGIQNENLDMGNYDIENVDEIKCKTLTIKDTNTTITNTAYLHRSDNVLFINNYDKSVSLNENGVLHFNTENYDTLLTDDNDIPNKKYVDNNSGDNLGNHTATQTLDMNENKITNISNGSSSIPSISFHASATTGLFSSSANHIDFTNNSVHSLRIHNTGLIESQITGYDTILLSDNSIPNKRYVDDIAKGLHVKASCIAKTVTLLPSYVATGSGSTKLLTASVNGIFPNIDDVPLDITDRLLIDNHGVANTIDAGIYTILSKGSATTKWELKRATDLDDNTDFQNGVFTFITYGTLSANKGYILIIAKNAKIDVHTQLWSEFTTTGDNLGDHIATTTLSMNNNSIEDLADGTENAPALSFNNSPGTGIYSPAVNEIAITTNQHKKLKINSTGLITADVSDGVSNIYTSLVNSDITNTSLTNKQYVLNRFLSSNFYIRDSYDLTFNISGLSQSSIITIPNASTISLNSANDLFGNTLKSTVINSSLQNLGTQNAELNMGSYSIKNISYLLSNNTNSIFGLNSTGRTFTDNAILGYNAGLSFSSNNNTILGSNAGNLSYLVGDVLNLNTNSIQNSVLLGYYAGKGLTISNYDLVIGSGNSINNQLIHGNFDNTNRHFSPAVDAIIGLGTASKKWSKIYANEIEATNLTITGNTVFVNTETLTIEDNIIQLNSSIDPATHPPSTLYGGIEINRGIDNKYWFAFHEGSESFKIGEVIPSGLTYDYSNLQPVATREDTPNDTCFAIWNNAEKRFVTNTSYNTSTIATQSDLLNYQQNITVTGGLNFSSNNLQVKPELYYSNEFKFSSLDNLITTNRTIILAQNYTPSSSSRYSLLLYVEFYIFDTNTTANTHYIYYDALYHNKLSSDSTETEFVILNKKYNYNTNITIYLSLTNSNIYVKINNTNPENKRVNVLAGLKYISNGTISFGSVTITNNNSSISANSDSTYYNTFNNASIATGNITTLTGTTAGYDTANITTGNITTNNIKHNIMINSFETGFASGTLSSGNRIAIATLPYSITNPISLSLEVNIELMDTTGSNLYKTSSIFVYLSKSNSDSTETAMTLVSRFDSALSSDSIRATLTNSNIYFYYQLANSSAGNKYVSISLKIKYSCASSVTFSPSANPTLTISSSLITGLAITDGYFNTYNILCNTLSPTRISNVLASSGYSSVSCSEISDSRLYITPFQVYGTTAGVGLNYVTSKTTSILRSGIQALYNGADKWRTMIDFNTGASGLIDTIFYTYNSSVDNSSNNWGMVERMKITNSTTATATNNATVQITGGLGVSSGICCNSLFSTGTDNLQLNFGKSNSIVSNYTHYFWGTSDANNDNNAVFTSASYLKGPKIYLQNTNGGSIKTQYSWEVAGPGDGSKGFLQLFQNNVNGTSVDRYIFAFNDAGNIYLPLLTSSTLLALDANKYIVSLSTATYPSLTELSYVKGVTSAIQTQINAKEPTLTAGTSTQYYRGDKSWQTLTQNAVANLTTSSAPTFAGGFIDTRGTSTDRLNVFMTDSLNRSAPLQVSGNSCGIGLNAATYTIGYPTSNVIYVRAGLQIKSQQDQQWRVVTDYDCWAGGPANQYFYTYNSGTTETPDNRYGMTQRLQITNVTNASSKTSGTLQVTGGLAVSAKLYAGAATFDSITAGTSNSSFSGNVYMNDKSIYFRNDAYHGIEFHGSSNLWASLSINGPVLYGNSGGALGSLSTLGVQTASLLWNTTGNTLYGTTNLNGLTASTLLALDSSKNIVSLTSSTTPSFTSVIGTTSIYSTYGTSNSSSYTNPSIYTTNGDAGALAFNAIADASSPYYTRMAIQGRAKPATNKTNVWRNLIQWDCWNQTSGIGHLTNVRFFTHYNDDINNSMVERMLITSNTNVSSLTSATVAITGGLAVSNNIHTTNLLTYPSTDSYDTNKHCIFPPYGMSGNTTTYTHNYCNGNVTITTCSDNTTTNLNYLFDRVARNAYTSTGLFSTSSPYNYTGATNYFGSYSGVWIKFSFPDKFILEYFGMYGSEGGGTWLTDSPYKYKLYGGNTASSTNISDWTLLIDNDTSPAFTAVIYQYFDLSATNSNAFNTYLLIINSTYGGASYAGYVRIGEVTMTGNPRVQNNILPGTLTTVDKTPNEGASYSWGIPATSMPGTHTQIYKTASSSAVVINLHMDDDIILINNATYSAGVWIVLPDSKMYKTMTKIYTIKDIGGNCLTTPIGFKSSNPNEKLDGVTYYPTATAVGNTIIAKYAANLNISTNYGYVTICVNSDTGWHLLGRDIIIPTISTQLFTTTTGQLAYDSTENLPMFYNGTFWQYLGMEKQISYNLIGTTSAWAGFNSSGSGVTLQIYNLNNDGYYSLQLQTPANGNYITLDFGTRPRGKYKVRTSFLGATDRAIVNITEMTTNTTIRSSIDTYRNTINNNNVVINTDYAFLFSPSSSTATLKIKYLVNGKNASSTSHHILINNAVELLQIG